MNNLDDDLLETILIAEQLCIKFDIAHSGGILNFLISFLAYTASQTDFSKKEIVEVLTNKFSREYDKFKKMKTEAN